jgi:hypothetical protein
MNKDEVLVEFSISSAVPYVSCAMNVIILNQYRDQSK